MTSPETQKTFSGRKVSFRVRRKYFDQIVKGEKKEELRSKTPFWVKRLLFYGPEIAVFLCGKQVHRRRILKIYVDYPEKVLGRPLSQQGRADIQTEDCIVTELGEAIEEAS